MADQPWNPDDEDLPPGTEDHEMPTRHVHPIEEYLDEMLAETRLSPSVPDLPPESDAVNDEAGWFAPNDAQDDDVPLFDEAALSGETVAHHVPADYDPADDDPGAYNPADYDPSDYDPAAYNPADYDPANYDPSDYDPADYGPVDDAGPAYSDQGYDEPPYDAEPGYDAEPDYPEGDEADDLMDEIFRMAAPEPDDLGETVVNPALAAAAVFRPSEPRQPAPPSYASAPPPSPVDVPQQPPVYGGFEDRSKETADSRRKGRTARERRESGLYLPWWSLLILLAGVALVATLIIVGLTSLGGQFLPGGQTPVVIVITSTPTRVPPTPTLPSPTPRPPTLTPVSTAEGGDETDETSESVITPAPEQVAVRLGADVEVFDVGPAGLNIREGAGTTFPVLLIAREGSLFEVVGGPEESGGFTWWQVRSAADPTIEGWTVAEYLRVTQ